MLCGVLVMMSSSVDGRLENSALTELGEVARARPGMQSRTWRLEQSSE
jgi:hypothetical protein